MSLKFVPEGPIGSLSALDLVMAWRPKGNKALPGTEPMRLQSIYAYMDGYASKIH